MFYLQRASRFGWKSTLTFYLPTCVGFQEIENIPSTTLVLCKTKKIFNYTYYLLFQLLYSISTSSSSICPTSKSITSSSNSSFTTILFTLDSFLSANSLTGQTKFSKVGSIHFLQVQGILETLRMYSPSTLVAPPLLTS